VAVLGDTAIFAGGTIRNEQGDDVSTQIDVYDGAAGLWSTTSLPHKPSTAASLTVRSVGMRALFFNRNLTDSVDIYDAATGAWSTASLPTVRGGLVAATVGSRALFVNGSHADLYDETTDAWTATTPLNIGSEPFRVQVISIGTTVLFVPRDSRIVLFDSVTGQWRNADPSAPRGDVAIAVVGTDVIFAGGRDSAQTSAVDIYDGRTGAWR